MANKTTLELDEETGKLKVKKDAAEALREATNIATPQHHEWLNDKLRQQDAASFEAQAEQAQAPEQTQTREDRRAAALERFQQQRAAERQQGAEIG